MKLDDLSYTQSEKTYDSSYVLQPWIGGGPPKQVVQHVIIHCAK